MSWRHRGDREQLGRHIAELAAAVRTEQPYSKGRLLGLAWGVGLYDRRTAEELIVPIINQLAREGHFSDGQAAQVRPEVIASNDPSFMRSSPR